MNECTGLPLVSYCSDGRRDGTDDPECTFALREMACEENVLSEEECKGLGCCKWDGNEGTCEAACLIPEDGAACCAGSAGDSTAPASSPAPNYVETAAPHHVGSEASASSGADATTTSPGPDAIATTAPSPGNGTEPSSGDSDPTPPSTSDDSDPSPTDDPTMQPTLQMLTPEPTPGASDAPTGAPVVLARATPPAPVKSASGGMTSAAAWIAMALAMAFLA